MSQLPPFKSLLKSRDVEDPVNLMVHRPLAYSFVWAVHKTPITPNGVTFLAMVVGIVAGAMFIWGVPGAMLAGGILLWTSAILDGADGILARAKKMQSDFGRALDGAADMIVAIFTVLPAFYHLWSTTGFELETLLLGVVAIVLTVPHLQMYDFYKESYLRNTRLDRGGEGQDESEVERRFREKMPSMGLPSRLAVKHVLLPFLRAQTRWVSMTNPLALREGKTFRRNEETARIYREHNTGPMRLWAVISLAPHSYLMAICCMFDRVDIYLWVRLIGMNAVWLVVMLWQRRATIRTMQELRELGAEPVAETVRAAA